MIRNIIFLAFAVLIATQATAINQMRNWTLPPNKVYMNFGSAPVVTSITGSSSTPYKAANGVYDASNNMLFYVKNSTIYTPNSTVVGSLPTSGSEFKEIVIVPVPGACKKYYVIMAVTWPLVSVEIWYTTVDCSSGSPVKGVDVKIATHVGNGCGLAASKIVSGSGSTALRYLYSINYSGLTRFNITNTGIASATTLASLPGLSLSQTMPQELDLSYDGTRLTWGESSTNGKVYQILTASPYTLTPYTLPTQSGCSSSNQSISGVEFDYNNNIWVSATSACAANKGIYKINTGTGVISYIASSSNYDNTQLEMSIYGLNGLIIAANNSGNLGYIDPGAGTISSTTLSIPITLYSNVPGLLLPTVYALVDQIDGEDYSYFTGMPHGVADFQINGTAASSNCTAPHEVYTCYGIPFTNTTTGTASSYTLQVNSVDASCNVVSGAGYLTYNSGPITTLPSDLGYLPGGNTWLYSHPGKYKVTLTVNNACSTPTTKVAYINVSDGPNATSLDVKINNPTTGTPCYSNDIAVPCTLCTGTPTMNLFNSNGNITYYTKSITTSAGMWTLIVEASNTTSVSGATNALSGIYVANDPSSLVVGVTYRLNIAVGNDCDESPIKGCYFKVVSCKTDGGETVTGIEEVTVDENFASLYPNPTAQNSELHFSLEGDSKVSLNITDLQGKLIAAPVIDQWMGNGEQQLDIPSSAFADGIYIYHLTVNDKTYQGKLVKSN